MAPTSELKVVMVRMIVMCPKSFWLLWIFMEYFNRVLWLLELQGGEPVFTTWMILSLFSTPSKATVIQRWVDTTAFWTWVMLFFFPSGWYCPLLLWRDLRSISWRCQCLFIVHCVSCKGNITLWYRLHIIAELESTWLERWNKTVPNRGLQTHTWGFYCHTSRGQHAHFVG